MGYGTGAAADAAQIVAWCDIHGLPGAPLLAGKLAKLETTPGSTPEVSRPSDELRVDAKGSSLLRIGSAALEYGFADEPAAASEVWRRAAASTSSCGRMSKAVMSPSSPTAKGRRSMWSRCRGMKRAPTASR
jgi:hypothetical protein